MNETQIISPDRVSTGIDGLDYILKGGLPVNRLYLVQGNPGTGKTTMGLQFLREGERKGEKGLYITLSESKEELLAVGAVARLESGKSKDSRFDRFRRQSRQMIRATRFFIRQKSSWTKRRKRS